MTVLSYDLLLDSFERVADEHARPYAIFMHPDDFEEVFFKYHGAHMNCKEYAAYVAAVELGAIPAPEIPSSLAWEDCRMFPDPRIKERGKFLLVFGACGGKL